MSEREAFEAMLEDRVLAAAGPNPDLSRGGKTGLFHPSASQISPDTRDGWNRGWLAATAHERSRILALIGDGLVDGRALKEAIRCAK